MAAERQSQSAVTKHPVRFRAYGYRVGWYVRGIDSGKCVILLVLDKGTAVEVALSHSLARRLGRDLSSADSGQDGRSGNTTGSGVGEAGAGVRVSCPAPADNPEPKERNERQG